MVAGSVLLSCRRAVAVSADCSAAGLSTLMLLLHRGRGREMSRRMVSGFGE